MENIFDCLRATGAQLSNMHATTDFSVLTAEELKTFMRLAGLLRQEADRVLACGAAEINQRSRHDLGAAGLAKAEGHVNPQTMIAALTGASKTEARKLDRLGKSIMQASPVAPGFDAGGLVLVDPEGSDALGGLNGPDGSDDPHAAAGPMVRPWFAGITDRLRAGEISPDRFEALRSGLGDATDAVDGAALAAAAERILDLLHPEDLPETVFRDARQARALLDRAGVAEEERQQLAAQEARIWSSRDGMVHLRADFAPEDGTWLKNTLDLLLGPRIGGPRLITGRAAEHAKMVENDPRSTEHIRAAAIMSLLKAGVAVDENAVLAQKRPAVQIVVTAAELTRPSGDGVAFIEGTGIPVSLSTVNRLVCDTGYVPVVLNADGSPLDLGREVRLFTQKQRLVIAALQGGCVWSGCEKPPSMCELHHIEHWCQGGKTDVNDGVLLCRHHHMLLHNHGWKILRARPPGHQQASSLYGQGESYNDSSVPGRYENGYALVPPRAIDPDQVPRPLAFRGVARSNAQSAGQRAS
jgi:hypothetical protein